MPDYKAMYLELFRASVQAAQLLQDAQARAEQKLLAEDPPPLRLEQAGPSPQGNDFPRRGENGKAKRGLNSTSVPDEGEV